MKYVYILQSQKDPERYYTGSTSDLDRRLEEHNSGRSAHTNKFRPWTIKTFIAFIAFSEPDKADEFELFLKSGSGRGFAKKRL